MIDERTVAGDGKADGRPTGRMPAKHRHGLADRAEATAVSLAAMLAIVKVIVFFLSGSIAILASAADSVLDIAASSINWLAVRMAAEPPDEEHSYGHGKFEAVAAVFQAGVVTTAACYLVYAAVRRFGSHEPLERVPLAIAIMAVSVVVSLIITAVLRRAARETGSVAVAGDALHYASDVLANLATIGALVLVQTTGEPLWDPLIAIMLTGYLLRAAWSVFTPAWDILVDRQLSETECSLIELALQSSAPPEVVGYYRLRTRTSGRRRFADVRVVFKADVPFPRIHDVTEELEAAVVRRLKHAEVVIHPEPLGAHGLDASALTWCRSD